MPRAWTPIEIQEARDVVRSVDGIQYGPSGRAFVLAITGSLLAGAGIGAIVGYVLGAAQ